MPVVCFFHDQDGANAAGKRGCLKYLLPHPLLQGSRVLLLHGGGYIVPPKLFKHGKTLFVHRCLNWPRVPEHPLPPNLSFHTTLEMSRDSRDYLQSPRTVHCQGIGFYSRHLMTYKSASEERQNDRWQWASKFEHRRGTLSPLHASTRAPTPFACSTDTWRAPSSKCDGASHGRQGMREENQLLLWHLQGALCRHRFKLHTGAGGRPGGTNTAGERA